MNILSIVCLIAVAGATIFLAINTAIHIYSRVKERKNSKKVVSDVKENSNTVD